MKHSWHFELGLAMALVVGYDQITSPQFQNSVPADIKERCKNMF
jgi:hypothetical protein